MAFDFIMFKTKITVLVDFCKSLLLLEVFMLSHVITTEYSHSLITVNPDLEAPS